MVLCDFALARMGATPFSLLSRSGFIETILTTPLRRIDLVHRQWKRYWRFLKVPLILFLASGLFGVYHLLNQTVFTGNYGIDFLTTFFIGWALGWVVLIVHLNALAWVSMMHGMDGKKPANAAGRTMIFVFVVPMALSMVPLVVLQMVPALGSGPFLPYSVYYGGQFLVLAFYVFLIRWAKARLGVRPPLQVWPVIPARFHPKEQEDQRA